MRLPESLRVYASPRMLAILAMGFASGLPLAGIAPEAIDSLAATAPADDSARLGWVARLYRAFHELVEASTAMGA